MTTGNGVPTATGNGEDTFVRDGSKNLRDIEDLVAKLQIVTKQLALPPRSMPVQRPALTGSAHTGSAHTSNAHTSNAHTSNAHTSNAHTSSAITSSADEFAHAQPLCQGKAGDRHGGER
jgi:hypothetical protein